MAQKSAADPTAVRAFAIRTVREKRPHLAKAIQHEFGVSRATAHNYLKRFLEDRIIVRTALGQYELGHQTWQFIHPLQGLEEHEVWANDIAPVLAGLPPNVIDIWHYGCTEMINNAIDHSESDYVLINADRSPAVTQISIDDAGVGIFRKIARALNLDDDRHAVLELSKGKVTTDPENHSGEGIFFSSRVFDTFRILSGGVFFTHERDTDEDWILADAQPPESVKGTCVIMALSNDSKRNLRDVFDEYATDRVDYRFDKTVVPVKLLEYGDDRLISRSQAKRLMNRFDRFRIVVLDFQDVESIGQAFADEVFRVFQSQHPEVEIIAVNANEHVARMTNRALAGQRSQRDLFADDIRQ